MLKETTVAAAVVEYLQEMSWDVYQEVATSSGGSIADIVARQGNRLWVVECKTSFGLSVLGQAGDWIRYAHFVSVAAPHARGSAGRRFGLEIAEWKGLGVMWVGCGAESVSECLRPRINRRVVGKLENALCEEQKTFAPAGNACGSRWSPWAQTCREAQRFVSEHQGCTVKEMVDAIRHHYASDAGARSSLIHWIRQEKLDGLRLEKDGRSLRLYCDKR